VVQERDRIVVGEAAEIVKPALRQRDRGCMSVGIGYSEAAGAEIEIAVEEDFPDRKLKCGRMRGIAERNAVGLVEELPQQREGRIARYRRRVIVAVVEVEELGELGAPELQRVAVPCALEAAGR